MQHLAKYNVPLYLRQKRAVKASNRHRRIRALQGRASRGRAAEQAAFGLESRILQLVAHGTSSQPDAKGRITFVAPAIFSIMENPAGVLNAVQLLASLFMMPRVRQVRIDLSKVTRYDLGANGLLDVLVEELSVKARKTGRRIRWSGRYPANPALRRFVQAMGVVKRLNIEHEYPKTDEALRMEAFDDRCKNYVRAVRLNESDRKSLTTKKFADHINRCLGRVKLELTSPALKKLCDYVGEILDNAEEHAGMYDWTIQGYLDTHLAEWMCEIVIFNFGATIAETLAKLPEDHYTTLRIKPYLDAHQKRGLFQSGWRREDLFTLIALQGGVSSKNQSDNDTRGNGTVDLIEFFQHMHSQCMDENSGTAARMTLISGSTHILFDGVYEMKKNASGIGVIAFNEDNDLHDRPDSTYITQLPGVNFPGTILSIKFPLANHSTAKLPGEQK